jgi:hypothetical protein
MGRKWDWTGKDPQQNCKPRLPRQERGRNAAGDGTFISGFQWFAATCDGGLPGMRYFLTVGYR